jgi:SpoU rRNA methylase family enzyme
MLNNEPITVDKLKELVELLEPKTVFLNQKTFDSLIQQIDFEPTNIVVNNFIPDNQAIIMNRKQLEEMKKGYFKPMF